MAVLQTFAQPKRAWYRQGWGKILLALSACLLVFIGLFGYLVFRSVIQLRGNSLDVRTVQNRQQSTQTGSTPSGVLVVPRDQVETPDDPTIGPTTAAVTIVEFGDFECPFCRKSVAPLKSMLERYGEKIRFIYRDFPNSSIHNGALPAALAANCANDQGKFWQYHDLLYANQELFSTQPWEQIAEQLRLDMTRFSSCMEQKTHQAEVEEDYREGVRFGVTGTPTWFINGVRIEGALDAETFATIIDFGLRGKLGVK